MFLEYGLDEANHYTHISQIHSGRVSLVCPYCGQALIARKGKKLAHHFAHDGNTCLSSKRDFDAINIPMLDRFNTYIDSRAWQALQDFHTGQEADIRLLAKRELVTLIDTQYHLTELGKIPFGLLNLKAFSDFQLSKIYERYTSLIDTVYLAKFGEQSQLDPEHYNIEPSPDSVSFAIIDLNIYRAQVARIFNQNLYILRIKNDSYDNLYKIGVTSNITKRISQIYRDISQIGVKDIELVLLLKHRGSIEQYAHHRYHDYHLPLDSRREYFQFDSGAIQKVLSDFKDLADLEFARAENRYLGTYRDTDIPRFTRLGLITSIMAGETDALEQVIKDEGQESDSILLDQYPQIVAYIQQGLAPQVIARRCKVSLTTVHQVGAVLRGH